MKAELHRAKIRLFAEGRLVERQSIRTLEYQPWYRTKRAFGERRGGGGIEMVNLPGYGNDQELLPWRTVGPLRQLLQLSREE